MKDYEKRAKLKYKFNLKSKDWVFCSVVVPLSKKHRVIELAKKLREQDNEHSDTDR